MLPSGSFHRLNNVRSVRRRRFPSAWWSSMGSIVMPWTGKSLVAGKRSSKRPRTLASVEDERRICAKITMSRTGIIGTRVISCLLYLNIRTLNIFPRPPHARRQKGRLSSLFQSKLQFNLASAHHFGADYKIGTYAAGQVRTSNPA